METDSAQISRSSAVPLLTFTEQEPTPLRCIAKGGSPPPMMEITVGRENYTKHFRFDSDYSMSGPVGFRTLRITTMMMTDEFRATATDDGKLLHCKAKVPGLDDVIKSAKLSINCKYCPFRHMTK